LARAEQIGAARVFIEHMAPASYAAAVEYGLDPTVVIAQSAHETGWGHFGGVLDATYFNVAGIKTREGGGNFDPEAHQRFDDWQHGAQAHASHLRAYTSVPLEDHLEDLSPRSVWVWPKNHRFTRMRQLGGHYAPSPTYGERVEAVAARLLQDQ